MGNTQAATAKDKVQAVNEKAKQQGRNPNQARPKQSTSDNSGFSNWRAGNFGSSTPAQKMGAQVDAAVENLAALTLD